LRLEDTAKTGFVIIANTNTVATIVPKSTVLVINPSIILFQYKRSGTSSLYCKVI